MGKVELRKVQAEPGLAKQVTLLAGDAYTVADVDTSALIPPRIRWLGTGRRVLNNKGKPVKEYEPFFSVTHAFEAQRALVESGVTKLSSYDSVDRLVRVDHPDGTFTRAVHGAWSVAEHDRNDTLLDSAWYQRRVNHLIDAELIAAGKDPTREAQAATQTASHAGTPRVRHLDTLGRPVLELEDNGRDGADQEILFPTIRVRDVDGNVLEVIDARQNTTVTYEQDIRGRLAAHDGQDGGHRLMLDDVHGQPVRSWDQRDHTFVFAYDDPLHRPTSKRVVGGDGPTPLDHLFERIIYGEGRPNDKAHNLRGRVALLYDTAGRAENVDFDFKGNLVLSRRRFAADHKTVASWGGANPDAALLTEEWSSSGAYDALNRVTRRTAADGSIYEPTYNQANLLEQVHVTQGGARKPYVTSVDYDERGQRRSIVLGNGVTTTYAYDRETFRLLRLTSVSGAGTKLQDLRYTYDPVGNVTHLDDEAVPTVWFDNQVVTALSTYRYDPIYRLVGATGREHAAQVDFGVVDNWTDEALRARVSAGDPLVWRNYKQSYGYDAVGNLTEVTHVAGAGSWTRGYAYAAHSNRLASTTVGANTYAYDYHPAHGFITSMPHLTVMRWNFRDELQAVSTQSVRAVRRRRPGTSTTATASACAR
jgi:YD repeat-containing protein